MNEPTTPSNLEIQTAGIIALDAWLRHRQRGPTRNIRPASFLSTRDSSDVPKTTNPDQHWHDIVEAEIGRIGGAGTLVLEPNHVLRRLLVWVLDPVEPHPAKTFPWPLPGLSAAEKTYLLGGPLAWRAQFDFALVVHAVGTACLDQPIAPTLETELTPIGSPLTPEQLAAAVKKLSRCRH